MSESNFDLGFYVLDISDDDLPRWLR